MNWRPRSLFSRLLLVLLGGLVVAQILSLAIHMHERADLLWRASGMQSARRIADIVHLLDTLSPQERPRVVQVLNTPDMTVVLGKVQKAQPRDAEPLEPRPVMFESMLRQALGDQRHMQIQASIRQISAASGSMYSYKGGFHDDMDKGYGRGMWVGRPHSLVFIVDLKLLDGTEIRFASNQPSEAAHWPYRLLMSLAILLASVIIVSMIAVRWATKPLEKLADAADELGRDIHRRPMDEEGPTEVIRAARAFNRMQARLVQYIEDRTRVLAAMSHDLKTPITRLRLRTELLDDEQIKARFSADLAEMETMVSTTLDYLRGIGSNEANRLVDVMALLESLQSDIRETGGEVRIEGEPPPPYTGRPQALKRCLMNLLDNAIKYGKSAVVRIRDAPDALEIHILDQGPGIASDQLEKVFEPYYRLEQSRNRETGGTGLGLAIARGIAESHGGRLILRNRNEGGLEAVLTLPRKSKKGHAQVI